MTVLFVAGTGTDIGKTFVTAGLLRFLRARSLAARALKPVMTGFEAASATRSDAGVLLAAMGIDVRPNTIDSISPFRFGLPLSPDMAAWREGRELRLGDIAAFCRSEIARTSGPILIEGVGGLMSPMARDGTALDLAVELGCPVGLVAGDYLGAISHSLTAAAAARAAGIEIRTLIVNESERGSIGLAETRESLERFLPGLPVCGLARGAGVEGFETIAQYCGFAW